MTRRTMTPVDKPPDISPERVAYLLGLPRPPVVRHIPHDHTSHIEGCFRCDLRTTED